MKDLPPPKFTNARDIPQAPFLERAEDYADDANEATALLLKLQELTQKYQFMEMNTTSRLKALLEKIPDIQKSLEMTQFLKNREEAFETSYELNDTVYARAIVPPTKTVFLWLGANVMLEYTLDEAAELLAAKLEDAHKSLDACREDLEFLRENITTMEVNTARVINYRVQLRSAAAPSPVQT